MEEFRLYEIDLFDAIERSRDNLFKNNKKYQKLRKELDDIFNNYPNLQLILEDNQEMILGKTECKMLQKLVKVYMEIRDFEEKEIFLLGGKEMYFYLKDVGILK